MSKEVPPFKITTQVIRKSREDHFKSTNSMRLWVDSF